MILFRKDAQGFTGKFVDVTTHFSDVSMCWKTDETIVGEITEFELSRIGKGNMLMFSDKKTGIKKRYFPDEGQMAIDFGNRYYNSYKNQLKK